MEAPQYAPTTVQRGGDTIATLLHATNALPRLDAELLLAHCLDTDCGQLYAYPEQPVAVATARRYHELAAARQRGVPLAYLRGWQGFWTLTVQVDPRVLVPRPESELLVEAALSRVAARWAQCAELGTGSGAIAWALARERPEWRILAIDRCADALAVASANRHQLRCHNTQLIQSDWGSALAGQRFDLLVSNPPYIDENDPQLRQVPLSCEPCGALASGGGGMSALRRLVNELPSRLVSGGWLMLEHAPWQATELRCALRAQGCLKITTLRDLADHERVTLGCAP